ncbi:Uncharacterised protein [Enterobacter hormaechei]|jgi:hypothetical protein|nr:Uncharacterised protein [Enterobacter hormaechei]
MTKPKKLLIPITRVIDAYNNELLIPITIVIDTYNFLRLKALWDKG